MGGDEPLIVVCGRTPAPCHGLRLRRRMRTGGSPSLGGLTRPAFQDGMKAAIILPDAACSAVVRAVTLGGERFNADKE
jgi:hypothetical protein